MSQFGQHVWRNLHTLGCPSLGCLLKTCVDINTENFVVYFWLKLQNPEIPDKPCREKKSFFFFPLVLHNSVLQCNYCTNFGLLWDDLSDLHFDCGGYFSFWRNCWEKLLSIKKWSWDTPTIDFGFYEENIFISMHWETQLRNYASKLLLLVLSIMLSFFS